MQTQESRCCQCLLQFVYFPCIEEGRDILTLTTGPRALANSRPENKIQYHNYKIKLYNYKIQLYNYKIQL